MSLWLVEKCLSDASPPQQAIKEQDLKGDSWTIYIYCFEPRLSYVLCPQHTHLIWKGDPLFLSPCWVVFVAASFCVPHFIVLGG